MAEFPPNLDDGELWLPSDIFVGEVPSKFHSTRRVDALPSTDNLSHHLAAFSLFQSPSISNFQRFQQPVQYGPVDPFVAAELCRLNNGLNVGRSTICRSRAAALYNSSKPVYEYNFLKPTHPQVEGFVEGRDRVWQSRVQCQVMAIQGRNGVGMGRERGGTGVFLPRVSSTSASTGFRKKQGPRNRRERCPIKREEEHCCKLSSPPVPEMVLPHDWTY